MEKIKCILLPGLDGTGKFLEEFALEISPYTNPEIIAYPQDQALTYAELANLVQKKLPAENYIIIAESFSGPISILLASQKPENLKGLILVASFASSPFPLSAKLLLKIAILLKKAPIPKAIISFFLTNGENKTATNVQKTINSINKNILLSRLKNALTCNVTKELSQITVPVLAITASNDRIIAKKFTTQMQTHFPLIQTAKTSSPHFALQIHPKSISENIIRPFVAKIL